MEKVLVCKCFGGSQDSGGFKSDDGDRREERNRRERDGRPNEKGVACKCFGEAKVSAKLRAIMEIEDRGEGLGEGGRESYKMNTKREG